MYNFIDEILLRTYIHVQVDGPSDLLCDPVLKIYTKSIDILS